MTVLRKITCYRYCLPLRGGEERQGLLFALEGDTSQIGWGEAAPLPGFSSETLEDVLGVSLQFCRAICGCSISELRERLTGDVITSPSLYFAFDSALRQIEDGALGPVDRVELCALMTDGPEQVEKALQAGYKTIKVKVGTDTIEEDIQRVTTLLHDFAGSCCWRFDANRAWGFEEALQFCEVIADSDVSYLEEPLQNPALLPQLFEQTGVPYAVDETLQELSACASTTDAEALCNIVEKAQALVWKPSLCLPPERLGLNTDAPVVLSGAYESGVGTAAILKHATGQCAAGIDTYSRLAEDVLGRRLPVFHGEANMQAVREAAKSLNISRLEEVWHV